MRYSGWCAELGEEFDKFIDRLNAEPDTAEREKIYAEMEQWACMDEVAVVPYMYSDTMMCVKNNVKGMTCPFIGPSFEFSRAYVVE